MKRFVFYLKSAFFLLLFSLSTRTHALTYVVDNLSNVDLGAPYAAGDLSNSLRKCIRLANTNAGADIINFNIATGPFIILCPTALPTITSPVTINGLSQPGAAAGAPLIQLVGGLNNMQILTLGAGADGSTIRGLVIYANNTGCIGITATASNTHTIVANFIGTDITGTVRGGTQQLQHGIDLNGSTGCTIGGVLGANTRNIVSSCANIAVRIRASSHNATIQGNYIGTTLTGNALPNFPNANHGIDITTSDNQLIGGTTYAAKNIIAGNLIGINAQVCNTLTIKGNFIGLAANGSALANTTHGVRVQNNGTASSALTIGGTTAPERNVISSCGNDAIQINNTAGVTIQNTYIGVDSIGITARANNGNGILIQNNSSTIVVGGSTYSRRNIIGNNTGNGIRVNNGLVSVVIKANFVGIAADGVTSIPNTSQGINVSTGTAVVIGGALRAERNIIGANGNDGIQVSTITGLTIQNNYIGFDSTGTVAKANSGDGMELNTSSTLLIGGSSYALRNVIGNNTQVGIRISNSTVSATIKGNFIGLSANGAAAGNGGNGIQHGTGVALTIGGLLTAERNIIGSNAGDGVNMSTITGVTIQNNYIGFDSTGLLARINTGDGIDIGNNSSTILVGGSTYPTRNIIGNNNQDGLRIANGLTSVIVKGNFIGLNKNGAAAGNLNHGLEISNSASVTIGGVVTAERNIVSSNTQRGMTLNTCTPVVIQNNYAGTDTTGMISRGNGQRGISVSAAASLTIGGTAYTMRNIASGNGQNGIAFDNCPGAIFKGNFVGLAKDGKSAMANAQHGVFIQNSNNTIIGGVTPQERNVVSCNLQCGFQINNSNTITVVNNYVGVDSTATLMRGNTEHGMAIVACVSPVIGGVTTDKRNIFSNNGYDGLRTDNSSAPTIQGNYCGVDITGLLDFGNGRIGINVYGGTTALIGGSVYGARNISSGNGEDGIFLHDNCAGSIVRANFTGVGADGKTILGNGNSGIRVWGGNTSNGIIIGGSAYVERNVSAANGATATNDSRDGIRMEGNAGGHIVKGNFCGTDSSGTLVTGYGNTWAGISVNEVTGGTIGGTGALEGNICANNGHEGIWLRNAVNNTIVGNFVGTDRTATIQMGNGQFGINVRYASLNNTIGGSAAEQNIVAYTKSDATDSSGTGVFIGNGSRYNKITYNKIYCNNFLGIALQTYNANEAIAQPTITAATINSVTGTGSIDGDIIHVYHNRPPSGVCDCEGEEFIGTATVSGGTWTLVHNLNYAIPSAYDVTATETTALNSTSQFSVCNTALPVEFVSFQLKKVSDHNIFVQWSTAWEVNNSYFLVERKKEKGDFETIARVAGRGNFSGLSNYNIEDQDPYAGTNYYRIRQVDGDGRSSTTAIKSIVIDGAALRIILTPNGVGILSPETTSATLGVYTELGQEVLQQQVQLNANEYEPLSLGLKEGIYLFYVATPEKSVWKKIPVR